MIFLKSNHVLIAHSQCAIPVFDGLLPEPHNRAILRLLFLCSHWHGLAKLRIHTDITLDLLDNMTITLGAEFRTFDKKTCSAFDTRELAREVDARRRRKSKKSQLSGSKSSFNPQETGEASSEALGPAPKKFNRNTYKYHSLGDYGRTIRRFGTTDSYSTENVSYFYDFYDDTNTRANKSPIQSELEHRTPKGRYARTDKKKFVRQLAQIERREYQLRQIRARLYGAGYNRREVVSSAPHKHHRIGLSQNNYYHIGTFLQMNHGDPAIKVGSRIYCYNLVIH